MSYNLDSNGASSKVIHINSLDASTTLSTGLTSYFRIFFEEGISCRDNERMLVSLHQATIPYSFYNIRNQINNIIPYKIDGGETVHTITIPIGSYTSTSLKNKLTTLLNVVLTGGVNITYDRTTQKFKYSCITATDALRQLTFDFDESPYSAHIELGFNPQETFVITATPTSSTNVIDVNGSIHGLFIRTNLTTDGSIDSKSKGLNTILGRLPIQSNFGSVLFFNPNNSTHKILIHNKTLNHFTIRLTDERNREVDLNGLHFTLAIQVDFVNIKHINTFNRYTQPIQYQTPQTPPNSPKKVFKKKKSKLKGKNKSK